MAVSYATLKEFIVVDEPAKPRVCRNCKHVVEVDDGSHVFCLNEETEKYLDGGMTPPITQPDKWYCPLFEENTGKGE